MFTRIGAASYLTLATLVMSWGAPALAAVQILENKVAGTLYLINVWGAGTSDGFAETASIATALSPGGEIVGYATVGSNTIVFKGTPPLGTANVVRAEVLPNPRPVFTRAFGVNDNGTIVGDTSASASGSSAIGFKVDPPTALKNINGTSIALGINASGQIVGQDNQSRAFLYKPNGVLTPLAATQSEARAINASGTVVGWRQVDGASQAFIYDGTVRDLLPPQALPPAAHTSEASAINAQGDVAGSVTTPNAAVQDDTTTQPFLLAANASVPVQLDVPSGFNDSFAKGVNAEKWVVGRASRNGQPPETATAWLWVNGQLFDLSRQLKGDWVTPASSGAGSAGSTGWIRLLSASAVSDSGLIVGEGYYQFTRNSVWIQERRAFLLDVDSIPAIPEPGIYLMLLSGLIAIGAVRLRRLGPQ